MTSKGQDTATTKALAERTGFARICPACRAAPGEGCRDERGMPQAYMVHVARIGGRR